MSTKNRVLVIGTATTMALASAVTWNGLTGPASAADGGKAAKGAPTAVGILTISDVPGTIPVLAYSWGVSNSGTAHSGGSGAGAGKANIQDISFTQAVEDSTLDLVKGTVTGQHFATAVFTLCDPASCASTTTLTYALTDVVVTSVSTGTSVGDQVQTANTTLDFAKFVLTKNGRSVAYDTSTGG